MPQELGEGSINAGGVKKTESEPSHSSSTMDPSVLLQDARRYCECIILYVFIPRRANG